MPAEDRYCPSCASPLEAKDVAGRQRPVCLSVVQEWRAGHDAGSRIPELSNEPLRVQRNVDAKGGIRRPEKSRVFMLFNAKIGRKILEPRHVTQPILHEGHGCDHVLREVAGELCPCLEGYSVVPLVLKVGL